MATSTSTSTSTPPWDPPVQQSYFPTSDLRFAGPPGRPLPATLLPPARLPSHSTASKYSNLLPQRTQIEPGVWSDGSDRVLSAACPSVQAFLNSARRTMSLPPTPSESVFALAALDVFYLIDDPVHWIFWNNEKKHRTAEVVSRISRTSLFPAIFLCTPMTSGFPSSPSPSAHSVPRCLERHPRIFIHLIKSPRNVFPPHLREQGVVPDLESFQSPITSSSNKPTKAKGPAAGPDGPFRDFPRRSRIPPQESQIYFQSQETTQSVGWQR